METPLLHMLLFPVQWHWQMNVITVIDTTGGQTTKGAPSTV